MDVLQKLWPIAILHKRYGNGWIAMANADHDDERLSLFWHGGAMQSGPWGGDQEAADFMSNMPQWAAEGDTPDAALNALLAKNGSLR